MASDGPGLAPVVRPISPTCVSGVKVTFCRHAVPPGFTGAGVIPKIGGGTGVVTTTRSLVAHGIQKIAAMIANAASVPAMTRLAIEPRHRQTEACHLQQHAGAGDQRCVADRRAPRK